MAECEIKFDVSPQSVGETHNFMVYDLTIAHNFWRGRQFSDCTVVSQDYAPVRTMHTGMEVWKLAKEAYTHIFGYFWIFEKCYKSLPPAPMTFPNKNECLRIRVYLDKDGTH